MFEAKTMENAQAIPITFILKEADDILCSTLAVLCKGL